MYNRYVMYYVNKKKKTQMINEGLTRIKFLKFLNVFEILDCRYSVDTQLKET